jgi:hypothetical protein
MTRSNDPNWRQVEHRRFAEEAWGWLPDWLLARLVHDRKSLGQQLLFSAFVSFLFAGVLTGLLAAALPWISSGLIAWVAPSAEVLEIFDHWLFYSAFGMTVFPVVWLGIGTYIFVESRKNRLVLEYKELLVELAFRQGQDQSCLRDSEGRYLGPQIATPWL